MLFWIIGFACLALVASSHYNAPRGRWPIARAAAAGTVAMFAMLIGIRVLFADFTAVDYQQAETISTLGAAITVLSGIATTWFFVRRHRNTGGPLAVAQIPAGFGYWESRKSPGQ